jgi:hypothetical protein
MCIWIDDFSGQLVPLRRPAPRVDCPRCHGGGMVFARVLGGMLHEMACDCAAGERWAYYQDCADRELWHQKPVTFLEWWLAERVRARAAITVIDAARWLDYAAARYDQQTVGL